MPSQPPLPPLLTSYLSTQPESSLTLVSSILGATSNWLVLRYLYAALSSSSSSNGPLGLDEPHNGTKRKVILVSFMRGWEFWRAEAKRLVSQFYEEFGLTSAWSLFLPTVSAYNVLSSILTSIRVSTLLVWLINNNLPSSMACQSCFLAHKIMLRLLHPPTLEARHAQHSLRGLSLALYREEGRPLQVQRREQAMPREARQSRE